MIARKPSKRYTAFFIATMLTSSTWFWPHPQPARASVIMVPMTAAREPVLIVPGIAGTILQKGNGAEVWPNIKAMIASPSDDYLDALALNVRGNAPAAGASTIQAATILKTVSLTIGGVTVFKDDFYGNLMKAFTAAGYVEGWDLFAVPYDWRLDVSDSVSALDAAIAKARLASSTGKINIVAHSMGGLLVKKYLAELSPPSFLDKVVLVGVPELGAPYAFKMLSYGDDLGIPVANGDEMKKIAQNMPAMYDLLPSEKYITDIGGYIHDFRGGSDAALDHAAIGRLLESGPNYTRNPVLLGLGDVFHRSIDDVPVAASSVYTIAGCGKPTITGYDLYDNDVVDLERGSGDGTVPEMSAMYLAGASHQYFVMSGETGIDHTALASDPRLVKFIAGIIVHDAVPTLPQGISTSVADCAVQKSPSSISYPGNESTIEFSVHGTATTTVELGSYDASGRYTGMTASGTVVAGIPGSEYEKIGNNVFILVPAGERYHTIGQSSATGSLVMNIRGYRAGALDVEATYPSVSFAGTRTFAELDFAGFGGDMNLRVERGSFGQRDTTIDKFIGPRSVLSAPFK